MNVAGKIKNALRPNGLEAAVAAAEAEVAEAEKRVAAARAAVTQLRRAGDALRASPDATWADAQAWQRRRDAAVLEGETAAIALQLAQRRLADARAALEEAAFQQLRPEHDAALKTELRLESEAAAQLAKAEDDLGHAGTKVQDAEAALSAALLRVAEGAGSKNAIADARATHVEARDRRDGAALLVRVLSEKLEAAHVAARRQRAAAVERSRTALMAEARALVEEQDRLHQQLTPLTRRARVLHRVLSQAVNEAPGHALDLVLNGHLPEFNSAAWISHMFAVDGGPLETWRRAAREAGLLPPTPEDEARQRKAQAQAADALVQEAKRDAATGAHLAQVFRASEVEK